jgi:hypothetical protein
VTYAEAADLGIDNIGFDPAKLVESVGGKAGLW